MLLVPSIGWKPGSGIVLEYKANATSTAATVAWPSVAAGDLAVLFDYAYQNISSPSEVTPSGFSVHVNQAGSATVYYRVMISSKICTGSESGNLTGMNGGTRNSKVLLIFSGGIASRASSTWNYQTTGGDPSSQSVTASGGAAPLIVFGMAGEDNAIPSFSTASPAFDSIFTVNVMCVGYKIYNASPQDHSIDMSDLGVINVISSGYLEAA